MLSIVGELLTVHGVARAGHDLVTEQQHRADLQYYIRLKYTIDSQFL